MIPSLLVSFAMVGLAAGLFGLFLARLLRVDGCLSDASETRHNAGLILVTSGALLLVSLTGIG